MEIGSNDPSLDRQLSWLERADPVGQVWGSSPHEPTIPFSDALHLHPEKPSQPAFLASNPRFRIAGDQANHHSRSTSKKRNQSA